MGTTGPLEDSDVQNIFKSLSQPGNNNIAPLSYANSSHPFHNFPASSFPQAESYGQSDSFSLSAHGSTFQQHPSFSNDQMLAAHQIHNNSQVAPPPPLPVPISSTFQRKSLSRPSSPSADTERLKSFLSYQSTGGLDIPVSLESATSSSKMVDFEMSFPSPSFIPAPPSAPPVSLAPASPYGKMANTDPVRGRHLKGEHVVFDIDGRLPGDQPPQLEVTPITMYTFQYVLLNGRQIAVSRNYICYGLRPNRHIRVININTASRSLLRGHSERITDMNFFGEDVHLLASASSDGRIFVRQIVEGPDKENKLQIADQILLAIQFVGDWDSVHPRVCWLCHTQDLLLVGISKYVFVVDIPTVRQFAAPNGFDVEDPIQCSVVNLIDGIRCIYEHDGDITDVTTSQWGLSASASNDGMIHLWKDQNTASFSPHQGQHVGAVAFLSDPLCPDHLVLLSAGPLCRELKLWVPATRDGWLDPSGQFQWKCIQTLELISTAGGNNEDHFFNQVFVVSKANIILLANAKKSSLYVVHFSFGSSPASTRLDYLMEYSVTWPILSFTATSENVIDRCGFVQVYCVQTQAIQQYSLDVSQCLPLSGHEAHTDLVHSAHSSNSLDTDRVATYEQCLKIQETNSDVNAVCSQLTSGISCAESAAVEKSDMIAMTDNVSFPISQPVPFSVDTASAGDSRMIGISGVDAKEMSARDVPVYVSKSSAPTPQVEGAIRSPRDSPLSKARARSPGADSPLFHVATAREKGYFTTYAQPEQPGERISVSSIPSSPKYAMWDPLTLSPRRHFNDISKINDDKEWHPSVSAVLPEIQNNTGSAMHLITPSELMSMVARSKLVAEGGLTGSSSQGSNALTELIKPLPSSEPFIGKDDMKGDAEVMTIETKEMNETTRLLSDETGFKKVVLLRRGVPGSDPRVDVSSNAALVDGGGEPGQVDSAHLTQGFDLTVSDEAQREDEHDASEERETLHMIHGDENNEQLQDVSAKVDNASAFSVASQTRRKKNKNKADTNAPTKSMLLSSVPLSNVAGPSDQDLNKSCSGALTSKLVGQMTAMQESVSQLVALQRDFQKQMQVTLAAPVAKEVKRVEAILGQRMEKVLKAHMEAMWARLQEDFAKREKADRDQLQQLSSYLSNYLNKDLPLTLERALKKEFSALGPSVARLVAPCVEKSITVVVNEVFQKGITEKGISQLEKSIGAKIEASLSKQLQSQFQTTGKHALQEALRSSLEGSVIPFFERSCQVMFTQVDLAFQKGFVDSQTHAQQQAATSAITSALQDALGSAKALATSLKGELADGQRKLLSLIEGVGVAPYVVNSSLPDKVMTVQHVEEFLDPTKELARLLSERKVEEAFNKALSLSNVGIVSWLCNQVELEKLLTTTPLPLSQGVLLALVQQLGCDLGNDTAKKLTWIKDAALALNPHDPGLPPHVMRHFLEKLYNNLHALLTTSLSSDLILSTRLVIHVVNSLLTACK